VAFSLTNQMPPREWTGSAARVTEWSSRCTMPNSFSREAMVWAVAGTGTHTTREAGRFGKEMQHPVVVVALILSIASSAGIALSQPQAPGLPELPSVAPDSFPPLIRGKVRKAYADAMANPHDATAVGKLGMILQAYQSNDRQAEVCYERARALDRKSFRWVYYLGAVQAARGQHEMAVKTFREALKLDPGDLPAQLKLGDSLLASGDIKGALSWLDSVVRQHPDSAQAYYELGRAQRAAKDMPAAIQSMQKACELFPNFGAAHYALALAYRRLGRAEEAQKEEALYEEHRYDIAGAGDRLQAELNELYTNPATLIGLGIELARQGKLEEAAQRHEQALAMDPEQIWAHINLISIYGRLSQFAKAEEHYRAAMRQDPNSVAAHFNFAVLLLNQGKYREAEEPLRTVLKTDPHHSGAHYYLGDILQRQGNLQEAMAEFRSAIAAKSDLPEAHFNLGRILVNQGMYKEGIEELAKALETKDEASQPTYLYALGAAYARSGDRKNGLEYMRRAREKAIAQRQSNLQGKIDQDLRRLEGTTSSRD
jgi:tetratricopeptide (TPR) repeat protein